MPTITVSDETYQRLQELAVPFQDREPEDVIRRLLNSKTTNPAPVAPTGGRELSSHAGRIPHGSKLRARYKGTDYEAEVVDGSVVWNGRHYDSISSAAVAVIQSTGSRRPTENGWRFWEVQTPGTNRWKPGTDFQKR